MIWTMNGWTAVARMALGVLGMFAAARIDVARIFATFCGAVLVSGGGVPA